MLKRGPELTEHPTIAEGRISKLHKLQQLVLDHVVERIEGGQSAYLYETSKVGATWTFGPSWKDVFGYRMNEEFYRETKVGLPSPFIQVSKKTSRKVKIQTQPFEKAYLSLERMGLLRSRVFNRNGRIIRGYWLTWKWFFEMRLDENPDIAEIQFIEHLKRHDIADPIGPKNRMYVERKAKLITEIDSQRREVSEAMGGDWFPETDSVEVPYVQSLENPWREPGEEPGTHKLLSPISRW